MTDIIDMDNSNQAVMEARSKYPAIVAWGQQLGSYAYYVDQECLQAAADGAPVDAIYKDSDSGEWRTVAYIRNEVVKPRMVAAVQTVYPEYTGEADD